VRQHWYQPLGQLTDGTPLARAVKWQ
jgi:hypothetical protein